MPKRPEKISSPSTDQGSSEIKKTTQESSITRREFLGATEGIFTSVALGKSKEVEVWFNQLVGQTEKARGAGRKIRFEILYTPHTSRKYLEGFREKVERADIYIPEALGWDQELAVDFQAVANGTMRPDEFFKKRGWHSKNRPYYSFELAELEYIHGSGKFVRFIDAPLESELFNRYIEIKSRADKLDLMQNSENLIDAFKEFIRDSAILHKEREQYMLSKLKILSDDISHGRISGLQTTREPRILLNLGAGHTGIYHELVKSGNEASRSFNPMPYIFSFPATEMIRRYLFDKEVSEELAIRTLAGLVLSSALTTEFTWPSEDILTRDIFIKKAVNKLSIHDIKEGFGQTRTSSQPSWVLVASLLINKLSKRGIYIPKSEKELDDFLHSQP